LNPDIIRHTEHLPNLDPFVVAVQVTTFLGVGASFLWATGRRREPLATSMTRIHNTSLQLLKHTFFFSFVFPVGADVFKIGMVDIGNLSNKLVSILNRNDALDQGHY